MNGFAGHLSPGTRTAGGGRLAEIQTLDKGVVLRFQIVAAVITAVIVGGGAFFGGRYLHQDEARKIQFGDRAKTEEADREAAKLLAAGYGDTPSFEAMKGLLGGGTGTVVPHPVQKYAPLAAIAGLVVGFLASHEAARVHARKKLAQASMAIGRGTQRFQNPR